MFGKHNIVWTRIVFTLVLTGMLALSAVTPGAASPSDDVKKTQQALLDKGYDPGPIDGHMGPHTREAIGKYQNAEDLPNTQKVDSATAKRLGVEPESVGSSFKAAGREIGAGGAEFGHEIVKGKPIAAGKELGKGIGRGGQDVGEGVKKAVSTDSDRGDSEKK